jgi:hypothetical protein
MQWPTTLVALLDRVEQDHEILALLGGPHVYHLPDRREYHIPMIAYTVIYSRETEVYEPFLIQWDVIAPANQIHALHARLRRLVSSDSPRLVGGHPLRMLYEDGRIHAPPEPGIRRHSFDVRYEPVRQRRY